MFVGTAGVLRRRAVLRRLRSGYGRRRCGHLAATQSRRSNRCRQLMAVSARSLHSKAKTVRRRRRHERPRSGYGLKRARRAVFARCGCQVYSRVVTQHAIATCWPATIACSRPVHRDLRTNEGLTAEPTQRSRSSEVCSSFLSVLCVSVVNFLLDRDSLDEHWKICASRENFQR